MSNERSPREVARSHGNQRAHVRLAPCYRGSARPFSSYRGSTVSSRSLNFSCLVSRWLRGAACRARCVDLVEQYGPGGVRVACSRAPCRTHLPARAWLDDLVRLLETVTEGSSTSRRKSGCRACRRLLEDQFAGDRSGRLVRRRLISSRANRRTSGCRFSSEPRCAEHGVELAQQRSVRASTSGRRPGPSSSMSLSSAARLKNLVHLGFDLFADPVDVVSELVVVSNSDAERASSVVRAPAHLLLDLLDDRLDLDRLRLAGPARASISLSRPHSCDELLSSSGINQA